MVDINTLLNDNIPLLLIIVVFLFFLFILFKGRKKEETYKKKDLDTEGTQEIKDCAEMGKKIYRDKYELTNGPIKLGRVTLFSPISWDSKISIWDNIAKTSKNEEIKSLIEQVKGLGLKPEQMIDNFYLFEIVKDTIIGRIKYLFNLGKSYHIVDKDFCVKSYRQYEINLYARPLRWYKNVYIYSEKSKAVALNISDKLTVKSVCNGVINLAPKIDFVEMRTANYAAKARELAEVKHTDWKRKEQNLNPDEEPNI